MVYYVCVAQSSHHLSSDTVDVLADLTSFLEKNPEVLQRFFKRRRSKRES
jgi:hypothetical protein